MDSEGDMCERKYNRDFPIIFIFLASFFIGGVLMISEFACIKTPQTFPSPEQLKEIHFWRKEFKEFKEQERIKKQQEDSWKVMDESLGLSTYTNAEYTEMNYGISESNK